jgi:response regulator RpfG family c-di-GMP phosphodiesterase
MYLYKIKYLGFFLIRADIKKYLKVTKTLTLLYVEDDKSIAASTAKLFQSLFHNVIIAENGLDGLEKFNENHIDLIITDINMPHLNGINMLKKIREIKDDIPAIITTAHNEIDYYRESINLNLKGFLIKPVILDDIFNVLKIVAIEKQHHDLEVDKISSIIQANQKLIDIGYQLSTEKDNTQLLESILISAKKLTKSDGGTLYMFNHQTDSLDFKIALNESLNIHFGGTKGRIDWDSLKLYNDDQTRNTNNVAVMCAFEKELINISNIYHSDKYDFSGARAFDEANNYETKSMLVVPLKNYQDELIGIIQLINKIDIDSNRTVSYDKDDEKIILSMSALASMVLDNKQLVIDLEKLLNSLIKSIGTALNRKSKHTSKHIDNVALLSEMISHEINKNQTIFKNDEFTDDELEEIRLSAWLHDIGKISTPEVIINKATKLETVFDRIYMIKAKYEILKKDIEISYLKGEISEDKKNSQIKLLSEEMKFINKINNGEIYLTDEDVDKLHTIYDRRQKVKVCDLDCKLLEKADLYNLNVRSGTLTKYDRDTINEHVVTTYDMLKTLTLPKKFSNVPKIAGSHHITVDGKGYGSKELMSQKLTLADRILAVADVFEALSAPDRPYKKPYTLNQIAMILKKMTDNNELDKDIVKMFFKENLHLQYAHLNMKKEQLDEVTVKF